MRVLRHLDNPPGPHPDDAITDLGSFSCYLDSDSATNLDGASVDWVTDLGGATDTAFNVRVTIELLNASGNVVGQNSADVMLPPMDNTSVEQTANIEVATAETAMQYRIVLMEIE